MFECDSKYSCLVSHSEYEFEFRLYAVNPAQNSYQLQVNNFKLNVNCCGLLVSQNKGIWKNWRPMQKNSTWAWKCYEGIVFLRTVCVHHKEKQVMHLVLVLLSFDTPKFHQQAPNYLRVIVVSHIILFFRIYCGGCSPYLCHQQITIPVKWHFMESTPLERANGQQMHFCLNTIS